LKYSDTFVNASARLIVRGRVLEMTCVIIDQMYDRQDCLGVPIISTNFPLIQNVDLQERIVFACEGTPISTNVNVTWYKDAVRMLNQSNR
jgi:hypothetical protein